MSESEKGMKVNEQRFALIIMLTNIVDTESGVNDRVKSAICASLMNMMEMSFIPGDDDALKDIINSSIDSFCAYIEEKHDVENYREKLMESVRQARKVVSEVKEKMKRVKDGEDILKNICLN